MWKLRNYSDSLSVANSSLEPGFCLTKVTYVDRSNFCQDREVLLSDKSTFVVDKSTFVGQKYCLDKKLLLST